MSDQTPTPVRTYYVRADGGETFCNECAGRTLTAAIEHGRKGQRNFLGLNGALFQRLDAQTAEAWRAESVSDGLPLPWVCEHEMQAALTASREARP